MFKFFFFITIFVKLTVLSKCAVDRENGRLVAAAVIFRHGDRTPVDPYPNDPYKDPSNWPVGFGQLTNTGKKQHFELGKWLRHRYDGLVSKKYNLDEMVVRSTDMDRTLMSALSNLAGFFPPQDSDVWNENLLWQPIPVHTVPENLDEILAAKKSCPVYDHELKKLYKSPEFKAYDRKYKPIYDYLTKHSGKEINSIQSVQYLYSCLHIEQLYNFTLPEWTKEVFPDKMYEISGLSFAVNTYTPLLARLKTGPLLREILTQFKDKSEGQKTRNLWIYSAHDTTVANMLNTLGVFKTLGYHNPPYVSQVLFELIEKDKEYFVQAFYRNTTGEPLLLNLSCGKFCPINNIFEAYKDVLPINWEVECSLSLLQMPLDINRFDQSLSLMTIFSFIALMMFVGILVLFIATAYKRRDYLSEHKWNNLGVNEWN